MISCEGCAPHLTGILTWDIHVIGKKRKSMCMCEVGGFMFRKCKYSAPEIAILTNEKGVDTKTRELHVNNLILGIIGFVI
jgi:hypothetical protein